MKKTTRSILAGIGGLALAAAPAFAEAYETAGYYDDDEAEAAPGMYSYSWSDPRLRSGIGVGFIVGGGISSFTDSDMRDVVSSDVGGLWNVRASIGTHIPIGIDLSYVGTANEIETLDGFDNGTLIGTSLEAAARWNILPHYMLTPYIFAGVGWQRYDLTDENFSTADTNMQDEDDLVAFPLGAGFAYRDPTGLVLDVRGTLRATEETSLLRQPEGDFARLHTWEASAAIGYEF